jgi:5-methylcytosine-specific restriction endonuclease McrA
MNVHHIDQNPNNNDPSNLITLCVRCHQAVTAVLTSASPSKIIEFVKVRYPSLRI